MRNQSHKTLISRLADHIDAWRKDAGMSQQTVVDEIVIAHDRIEGPATTGIEFEGNSDEFRRLHANSQRVWRWLDDKSKDTGLMPMNFLPTMLAAMPEDTRRAFLSELLAPVGLGVRSLDADEETDFTFEHVCDANIETATAIQLLALAHKNPTEENLDKAERASQKVTERFTRTRKVLAGAKAAFKKTGSAINKAFHRSKA